MSLPREERRIHRVFVTKNTEYHVRQDLCVGVRDRRSGRWLRSHIAFRNRVCGALRFTSAGGLLPNPGDPMIGESLFISAGGRDVVTSQVLSIERPDLAIVANYAA